MVRSGKIAGEDGEAALATLETLPFVRYSHEPLRARVWELRHNLTAYDASYLALAETLDGSVLVTGDSGLYKAAVDSLGAEQVRRLPGS